MSVAQLSIDGKNIELPVIVGTEGEVSVDISKLRGSSGVITLDPAYVNTGSCQSKITFIDGEKGILRYRGYAIEDVCEGADFLETAYMLIHGELPNQSEYDQFVDAVQAESHLDTQVWKLIKTFPRDAHPMGILGAAFSSLSAFYGDALDPLDEAQRSKAMIQAIAKVPSLVAAIYRHRHGLPLVNPRKDLDYTSNFLNMMFAVPGEENGPVDSEIAKALDLLLILHADHEQNCSAATVRIVGSSQVNLFASLSAGAAALWGPLHGGANQKVIEMLQRIAADGSDVEKYVNLAKDKESGFRLMGFGHRVYKNFDPRARIIKKHCDLVLKKLGVKDPLLDIAASLEETALNDDYFAQRKLYPNVDFYSGIIYKALGIPIPMFTTMFALGRTPGWVSQWYEMITDPKVRIGRPRQVYQGATLREFKSKVEQHR